jgi:hypothetical protein
MIQGCTPKNYNDDEDRDERDLAACVHALKHKQGLVHFRLGGHVIRTETIIALLHYLKTHPTGSGSYSTYLCLSLAFVELSQRKSCLSQSRYPFMFRWAHWKT